MTNKEMIKANARIRELEAENRDLLDELEVVNQKKISNWLRVKKLEYEIDKLNSNATLMFHQDCANRLAVVADALASECEELKARAEQAEAKLRELIELLEAADDEIFHNVDEYTGQCLEGCLSCRIEAALKAALEEQ